MMNILSVYGTGAPRGRLGQAEASLTSELSEDAEVKLSRLDLSEVTIPWADGRAYDELGAAAVSAVEAVKSSEALVIFSPIYKGGLPGSLKNLFDILPSAALEGKAVGCVAMGGSFHHFLAADAELRRLASWFGAVPTPNTLYLTGADFEFGSPRQEVAETLEHYSRTVKDFGMRLRDIVVYPPPLGHVG